METPREKIKNLVEKNGDKGFYGTHHQFVVLIESDLKERALKIMKSLNTGFLWDNERAVHNAIYNFLLDGYSTKEIKNEFKY